MTTATVTPPPQPLTARMTAEEFGLKYAGSHVEYINGEVQEMPMAGGRHGVVVNLVAYYLTQHVLSNHLGRIFGADSFVKVPTPDDPERVYGPDIMFVSYDRLARDAETPIGVVAVTPNLVVEVRSPTDTWTAVFGKVADYLKARVPVVVLLDPQTKTVSVYGDAIGQQIHGVADTLTLPDVLPGFAVPVRAFFE